MLIIYLKRFITKNVKNVIFVFSTSIEDHQLICKCINCDKNHRLHFDKESIKIFANIYEFCDRDIDKFILLLRKGAYPYEYMDSWERFNKTLLLSKRDFYSSLNMEEITDVD